MNLDFSDADQAFRLKVRDFFVNHYPRDLAEKNASGRWLEKDDFQRSERALSDHGYLAISWPKEYGGTGWSETQKYIFDDEMQKAGAILPVPMGLHYIGPVLYTFGTHEQKERFLPGILNATTFWAQGYSEPESGSDLASLQCAAVLDGDHYVVNGEKIWTSQAHMADWIFLLVRTDNSGKKQQGITFLMADITSPGITVHDIKGINGDTLLNRVVFDNVKIPVKQRIGEEGQGWTYSQYLLQHERTSYVRIGLKRDSLRRLKLFAETAGPNGTSLMDDPLFAATVAEVEISTLALEAMVLRVLSAVESGNAPGKESSILKVLATENAKHIQQLYVDAAGYEGFALFDGGGVPEWAIEQGIAGAAVGGLYRYLDSLGESIYGGTNEIQKNIVSKRVLGM